MTSTGDSLKLAAVDIKIFLIKPLRFMAKATTLNALHSKDLLMVSLSKFYGSKENIEKIMPIVTGKSEISLRLLDWFVTNYSKKNSTVIIQRNNNEVENFIVYVSYRAQLKAYSKQQFDPFRRRDRIKFYYEQNKYLETTIGQLNFFKWVILNNIIEYIEAHKEEIENDMIVIQKRQNAGAGTTEVSSTPMIKGKKRLELSKSFLKNMNTFSGSRTISFS
jgi:hypothetical protein